MDENRIMVNKQIQQLAEQAGLYFYLPNGNAYPCAMSAEECELAYRKFAELILADCIKAVEETPLGYGDYRDQILESMRNSCVGSIKYHFGVGE